MRAPFLFARVCLRQSATRSSPSLLRTELRRHFTTTFRDHAPRKSLGRIRRPIALLALLSPGAFVKVSQDGDAKPGTTPEEAMLEMSREEIEEIVPKDSTGLRRILYDIVYIVDRWIWEPLATTVRFLHLVVIFVPVIATIPVMFIGMRQKNRDSERTGTLWWYSFLVHSMERAGAAFIKLGQWAASRQDIFPQEMCNVMSSLHSNAPAHALKDTKKIIVQAFGGRKFEEIFEEFHEDPMGVGAIAQVYKAKLKPDLAALADTDLEEPSTAERVRKNVDALVKSRPARAPSNYVAVKVLHPKIDRIVRRDLKIMGGVAWLLNLVPGLEWFSFPDEVSMFGEMMKLQLDLRIEAANLTMFRQNFKDRSTAWFPYPYSDYTTRKVLVEEFAHGVPLAGFLEDGAGPFQKEVADEGLDSFLRMLLIDNFTHADLHPGNIMVRFYKPERIELSFGRHKESEDPDKSADVTDEVMAKLKPYRKQPEQWIRQLEKIDAEGYRPQLIFIDAGLVTALNDTNRANFLDLFKAVAEFDGYRAGHLMVDRCRQPDAVLDAEVFALKMQHLVLGVKSRTFALGNIKIGDVLNNVMSMVREHHVRMEGDFINVVLSILLLEGIGRSLDPDLDLFKSALPILRSLGTQSGSGSLAKSIWKGDFSMLKVWVGLEARGYLQALQDDVERCVKYDLLSPNV